MNLHKEAEKAHFPVKLSYREGHDGRYYANVNDLKCIENDLTPLIKAMIEDAFVTGDLQKFQINILKTMRLLGVYSFKRSGCNLKVKGDE